MTEKPTPTNTSATSKPESLFDALRRAVAQGRAITGPRAPSSVKKAVRAKRTETETTAQAAERLNKLLNKLRAEEEWRPRAVCYHVLHIHCIKCGSTTKAELGLLLQREHRLSNALSYIPISSIEGFEALPRSIIHRQQTLTMCSACEEARNAPSVFQACDVDIRQLSLPL